MAKVFDCTDSAQLLQASRAARSAIGRGDLVVLPTDTVYGVAADAFSPEAVAKLLEAKHRTRQSPPPVLIADKQVMNALAAEVTEPVMKLAEAFWPGPLTMVMIAQPSLAWDLGETSGTVALRVPDSTFTREFLSDTGPLAVSSANTHGEPAAKNTAEAVDMLGESIAVYLDDGDVAGDGTSSTILDVTSLSDEKGSLRILRHGGITLDQVQEVLPHATINV
ncbi:MAG: L-threonylcarbamoyladenylate synthase [Canibacter sp.]